MLDRDPRRRPSIEKIKGHPWFSGDMPAAIDMKAVFEDLYAKIKPEVVEAEERLKWEEEEEKLNQAQPGADNSHRRRRGLQNPNLVVFPQHTVAHKMSESQ
jgi:hypothetical protein